MLETYDHHHMIGAGVTMHRRSSMVTKQRDGTMDSKLRLIFLAHPRSGSTSLFQILQLHPDLDLLEEPFNENFTRWNSDHPSYRDHVHDTASLDIQLAAIFARYNGFKVLDYQLPDDLLVHLLHQHASHVLFLRRRNLLQTVVSNLIAEQTQVWKKWDMTQPLEDYYRNLQPLDTGDVQRRIAELDEHLAFCESVIDARSGGTALKLIYEDLYFAAAEQRTEQVSMLWRWLGLTPLDTAQIQYYLHPAEVKINSTATYAWIPNAHEIEEGCGNAVTGWLFR